MSASVFKFKPWPKIGRVNQKVVVTEKIDGTNGCIVISDDGNLVAVQSRKRFIHPHDDNYGFAQWVYDNGEELEKLGPGYHYGEWAGEGIQKNPHNLSGKHFFLFNVKRWGEHNPNTPKCCDVVPILYQGEATPSIVQECMDILTDKAEQIVNYQPEGIVIYYPSTDTMFKHTFNNQQGKFQQEGSK